MGSFPDRIREPETRKSHVLVMQPANVAQRDWHDVIIYDRSELPHSPDVGRADRPCRALGSGGTKLHLPKCRLGSRGQPLVSKGQDWKFCQALWYHSSSCLQSCIITTKQSGSAKRSASPGLALLSQSYSDLGPHICVPDCLSIAISVCAECKKPVMPPICFHLQCKR